MPLTPDDSRIDEIIDQSALVAQGIPNITAVWGVGSDKVTDPNLTAAASGRVQTIRAGPPQQVAPGVHFSDWPDAGDIRDRSATVSEITHRIPMRVYFSRNDEATTRKMVGRIFNGYLHAFAANTQLNGTVQSALITHFQKFTEGEWFGYDFTLTAIERLNRELQP